MTDPRKTVANHKYEKQVGKVEGKENRSDELQNGKQGSDEVQPPAYLVRVLREVKGVKLVQSLIILLHQQNLYKKIIIPREFCQVSDDSKDRDHTYQAFFFKIFGRSERNWLQI